MRYALFFAIIQTAAIVAKFIYGDKLSNWVVATPTILLWIAGGIATIYCWYVLEREEANDEKKYEEVGW